MTIPTVQDLEVASQEMAMHMALCVVSEYIHSWGVSDFLEKTLDYVQGQGDWYDLNHALMALQQRNENQPEEDNDE